MNRNLTLLAVMLGVIPTTTQGSTFTLIDGEGFEAPAYEVGDLEGQFALNEGGMFRTTWLDSPVAGAGTATVQSNVVFTGDQAVRVDRAANSNDRWFVPVTSTPGTDFVGISWDMRVESSGLPSGSLGPFFGIEDYDSETGPNLIRLTGLGVDATSGEVLYNLRDDGVGLGIVGNTGAFIDFGEWNSFLMVLDFRSDTASYFLNGNPLLSTAFEQDGGDAFTDADIAALSLGFDQDSLEAIGTAYFDNYLVLEDDSFASLVPEPSSYVLLVLGGMLIGIRCHCRKGTLTPNQSFPLEIPPESEPANDQEIAYIVRRSWHYCLRSLCRYDYLRADDYA